jgi:hypothetical protein
MPTCRTIDVDLVAAPARDVVDRLSDNAWEVARLSCSYQCSNAEMSSTRDVVDGSISGEPKNRQSHCAGCSDDAGQRGTEVRETGNRRRLVTRDRERASQRQKSARARPPW